MATKKSQNVHMENLETGAYEDEKFNQTGNTEEESLHVGEYEERILGISGSPILATTITTRRLEKRGYRSLLSYYLHRHSILMNRRDTRTVRPVV